MNRPNWVLYHYRVDFEPSIESKRLKSSLLYKHKELFENIAFDGESLFLIRKLNSEVTKLESVRNFDQKTIQIQLRLVSEITPNTAEIMQFMNIVFKRCLTKCKFKEFGRERAYFDFNDMHEMRKYQLNIAAGYKASIGLYENRVLLCTEVAHKLINLNTIYDVMKDIHRKCSGGDYKQQCYDKLIGCTMMAGYNRRPYRIDDIAWDLSPGHTFEKRDGTKISFAQYYQENYDIKIRDMDQPLLASLPKERDKNREKNSNRPPPGPIYLVPELCFLTGKVFF